MMRAALVIILLLTVSCGPVDTCDNPCELGQTTCFNERELITCAPVGEEGCLRWSSPEGCGDHQVCVDDACLCADTCTLYEAFCGPNRGRITCEGPDRNGCNYWGPEEPCRPDGCVDVCGCATDCLPDSTSCSDTGELLVCQGPDPWGCTTWSEASCGEHQTCREDECTCRTACTPGMGVCNGFDAWSLCQGPDEDGCPFIGDPEPCPPYRRCDSTRGRCERETPARCYPVNQCDFEGQLICMDETRYRECFRTRRGCLLWNGCET